MEFNVNHPILFVFVGLIIAAVIGQSVFFLVKAYRRAKEIGMDMTKIHKTIKTAAIFTVAPAVSIVITVVALSQSLGIALPWLRLSVIGSLSYEMIAANNAMNGFGEALGGQITDASVFVTILWVMTVGILLGLILTPLLTKKIQNGMIKLEKSDPKWREIFNNAMFLGMISAFLGFVFCDVYRLWSSENGIFTQLEKNDLGEKVEHYYTSTSGLVPVLVMVISALVMALCGFLMKKFKWKWINDYALPISMVAGMACAIPLTNWLGGEIL
jgi:hypothetical protein